MFLFYYLEVYVNTTDKYAFADFLQKYGNLISNTKLFSKGLLIRKTRKMQLNLSNSRTRI